MLLVTGVLLMAVSSRAITNNADLIWYDDDGQTQNYFARQAFPEGFNRTRKIIVNQKFPYLWEVKFSFFDNLEELVIDDCGVNEIKPNTFKDLKPLTNLSLSWNHIKEIKEGIFNFVEVKNLNLSHNRIRILADRAFDNMPVLERVILDFNELKHWSGEWFSGCPQLATVSMTHNFLEELPAKAFKNFWRQQEVANLYFSYNKIRQLDREVFLGSAKFGDLFLDWNDVPRIDGHTFATLQSVNHLNLNGDSLRCLSEEFLTKVLNKTQLLSVVGNPLKCECFKELIKREKEIKTKIKYSTVDC
ncbi:Chaoptin-like Protein [Tribolium castaneum]|uniref:Chaoptin-like Protein n=1 Tax=Tribolium castaneum TaxID=7070 RepID=D6WL94_TRICA|nr:PREDICTED: insulin-like growth factor-binding protein complex acid labile subunit [Tribolium castaneum]EFA04080.1 Chaoptin-like Protein [Tribolium castaneum]|eukprot:XP_008193727.1 PREDICTED: insulin-like growth factor-binding protein complex acid labile subunit [Tribolium castaneum]